MAFLHRKLITDSDSPSNIPNTTPIFCNTICVEEKQNGSCPPSCLSLCPNLCNPTTPISNQSSSHEKASIFLIVGLSLLATTFFLVCFYVFYRKYWLSSRIRRPISDSQVDDENNDHSNHSNDQVLIHPIWYINTVGLQSSVINSITVCKYKKGEGLIEDLDCAVCLSEFEEDESLRLLPKCSHAFHLPCIDIWLRSHTNCPLCRAPILVTNVVTSISTPQEETQLSILENDGESDTQRERDQVHELRIRIENEEEQEQVESMNEQVNRMSNEEAIRRIEPRRRSVSLDSFSASKIVNESHSRFVSDGNSNTQLQVVNKSKSVNGAKGMGLGLQKFQRQKGTSSSKGRSSHKSGAISMKRSFSNSGIHRQIQSRDSNRPLRSF